MSRLMKDKEVDAFEKKFGYKPTAIAVAIDALAIFVHKDNPIQGLSVPQVDAIFSSTRTCGAPGDMSDWGDVGLGDTWTKRDIQLYGRNSVSGTYGYFKSEALCNGDFKNTVNEQPGSASVVQSVSTSINSIGYSGIGYTTSSVRTVPLSRFDGKEFVTANPENAIAGSYPLSRFLYIYVNKAPGQPLPPLTSEFLRLVLSREGQEAVIKDGYIPLTAGLAEREISKIQ
jgi:phosphate transport system substrate-binding protein